jgi:uncharacterized peroxidase-related enzyme
VTAGVRHFQRIPPPDPAALDARTKEHLNQLQKRLHRVPNMHATMAGAPAVLDAFLGLQAALARGTLEPELRARLALAVSAANSAEYCLAAHEAAGRALKIPDHELAAARDAKSANPKWQAALKFTRAIVENMGMVADADLSAVRAAGWSDAAVLEMVAAAALGLFGNYFNHVVDTQLDAPPAR